MKGLSESIKVGHPLKTKTALTSRETLWPLSLVWGLHFLPTKKRCNLPNPLSTVLVYISENNRNLDTCISEHESGDQDRRVKCYCHACLEKGTCYLVELGKNSKAESNWQRYTIKRLGWLEVATTWTTGPSFHLLLVCSCSCHERPIIMELILNMKHTLEQTVNFLLQDLCMEGEGFPVQDFLRLSYTSCRRKLNIWSSSGVHHGNLTPWTVTS